MASSGRAHGSRKQRREAAIPVPGSPAGSSLSEAVTAALAAQAQPEGRSSLPVTASRPATAVAAPAPAGTTVTWGHGVWTGVPGTVMPQVQPGRPALAAAPVGGAAPGTATPTGTGTGAGPTVGISGTSVPRYSWDVPRAEGAAGGSAAAQHRTAAAADPSSAPRPFKCSPPDYSAPPAARTPPVVPTSATVAGAASGTGRTAPVSAEYARGQLDALQPWQRAIVDEVEAVVKDEYLIATRVSTRRPLDLLRASTRILTMEATCRGRWRQFTLISVPTFMAVQDKTRRVEVTIAAFLQSHPLIGLHELEAGVRRCIDPKAASFAALGVGPITAFPSVIHHYRLTSEATSDMYDSPSFGELYAAVHTCKRTSKSAQISWEEVRDEVAARRAQADAAGSGDASKMLAFPLNARAGLIGTVLKARADWMPAAKQGETKAKEAFQLAVEEEARRAQQSVMLSEATPTLVASVFAGLLADVPARRPGINKVPTAVRGVLEIINRAVVGYYSGNESVAICPYDKTTAVMEARYYAESLQAALMHVIGCMDAILEPAYSESAVRLRHAVRGHGDRRHGQAEPGPAGARDDAGVGLTCATPGDSAREHADALREAIGVVATLKARLRLQERETQRAAPPAVSGAAASASAAEPPSTVAANLRSLLEKVSTFGQLVSAVPPTAAVPTATAAAPPSQTEIAEAVSNSLRSMIDLSARDLLLRAVEADVCKQLHVPSFACLQVGSAADFVADVFGGMEAACSEAALVPSVGSFIAMCQGGQNGHQGNAILPENDAARHRAHDALAECARVTSPEALMGGSHRMWAREAAESVLTQHLDVNHRSELPATVQDLLSDAGRTVDFLTACSVNEATSPPVVRLPAVAENVALSWHQRSAAPQAPSFASQEPWLALESTPLLADAAAWCNWNSNFAGDFGRLDAFLRSCTAEARRRQLRFAEERNTAFWRVLPADHPWLAWDDAGLKTALEHGSFQSIAAVVGTVATFGNEHAPPFASLTRFRHQLSRVLDATLLAPEDALHALLRVVHALPPLTAMQRAVIAHVLLPVVATHGGPLAACNFIATVREWDLQHVHGDDHRPPVSLALISAMVMVMQLRPDQALTPADAEHEDRAEVPNLKSWVDAHLPLLREAQHAFCAHNAGVVLTRQEEAPVQASPRFLPAQVSRGTDADETLRIAAAGQSSVAPIAGFPTSHTPALPAGHAGHVVSAPLPASHDQHPADLHVDVRDVDIPATHEEAERVLAEIARAYPREHALLYHLASKPAQARGDSTSEAVLRGEALVPPGMSAVEFSKDLQVLKATHQLAAGLYDSAGRSFMELLQNADDAAYHDHVDPEVSITLEGAGGGPPCVRMSTNERGFRAQDVAAVCKISSSTKTGKHTGNKGVGFKSVFALSRTPQVHSGHFHFGFDIRDPPAGLGIMGYLLPVAVAGEYTAGTEFVLPLDVGHRRSLTFGAQTGLEALQRAAPTLLLSLKRLRKIRISTGLGTSYLATRRPDTQLVRFESPLPLIMDFDAWARAGSGGAPFALTPDAYHSMSYESALVHVDVDTTAHGHTRSVAHQWLQVKVRCPTAAAPAHPRGVVMEQAVLSVALPLPEGLIDGIRNLNIPPEQLALNFLQASSLPTQSVHACLPMKDCGFRFIIDAPWEPSTSRQGITDDDWDHWLAQTLLPAACVTVLHALRDLATRQPPLACEAGDPPGGSAACPLGNNSEENNKLAGDISARALGAALAYMPGTHVPEDVRGSVLAAAVPIIERSMRFAFCVPALAPVTAVLPVNVRRLPTGCCHSIMGRPEPQAGGVPTYHASNSSGAASPAQSSMDTFLHLASAAGMRREDDGSFAGGLHLLHPQVQAMCDALAGKREFRDDNLGKVLDALHAKPMNLSDIARVLAGTSASLSSSGPLDEPALRIAAGQFAALLHACFEIAPDQQTLPRGFHGLAMIPLADGSLARVQDSQTQRIVALEFGAGPPDLAALASREIQSSGLARLLHPAVAEAYVRSFTRSTSSRSGSAVLGAQALPKNQIRSFGVTIMSLDDLVDTVVITALSGIRDSGKHIDPSPGTNAKLLASLVACASWYVTKWPPSSVDRHGPDRLLSKLQSCMLIALKDGRIVQPRMRGSQENASRPGKASTEIVSPVCATTLGEGEPESIWVHGLHSGSATAPELAEWSEAAARLSPTLWPTLSTAYTEAWDVICRAPAGSTFVRMLGLDPGFCGLSTRTLSLTATPAASAPASAAPNLIPSSVARSAGVPTDALSGACPAELQFIVGELVRLHETACCAGDAVRADAVESGLTCCIRALTACDIKPLQRADADFLQWFRTIPWLPARRRTSPEQTMGPSIPRLCSAVAGVLPTRENLSTFGNGAMYVTDVLTETRASSLCAVLDLNPQPTAPVAWRILRQLEATCAAVWTQANDAPLRAHPDLRIPSLMASWYECRTAPVRLHSCEPDADNIAECFDGTLCVADASILKSLYACACAGLSADGEWALENLPLLCITDGSGTGTVGGRFCRISDCHLVADDGCKGLLRYLGVHAVAPLAASMLSTQPHLQHVNLVTEIQRWTSRNMSTCLSAVIDRAKRVNAMQLWANRGANGFTRRPLARTEVAALSEMQWNWRGETATEPLGALMRLVRTASEVNQRRGDIPESVLLLNACIRRGPTPLVVTRLLDMPTASEAATLPPEMDWPREIVEVSPGDNFKLILFEPSPEVQERLLGLQSLFRRRTVGRQAERLTEQLNRMLIVHVPYRSKTERENGMQLEMYFDWLRREMGCIRLGGPLSAGAVEPAGSTCFTSECLPSTELRAFAHACAAVQLELQDRHTRMAKTLSCAGIKEQLRNACRPDRLTLIDGGVLTSYYVSGTEFPVQERQQAAAFVAHGGNREPLASWQTFSNGGPERGSLAEFWALKELQLARLSTTAYSPHEDVGSLATAEEDVQPAWECFRAAEIRLWLAARVAGVEIVVAPSDWPANTLPQPQWIDIPTEPASQWCQAIGRYLAGILRTCEAFTGREREIHDSEIDMSATIDRVTRWLTDECTRGTVTAELTRLRERAAELSDAWFDKAYVRGLAADGPGAGEFKSDMQPAAPASDPLPVGSGVAAKTADELLEESRASATEEGAIDSQAVAALGEEGTRILQQIAAARERNARKAPSAHAGTHDTETPIVSATAQGTRAPRQVDGALAGASPQSGPASRKIQVSAPNDTAVTAGGAHEALPVLESTCTTDATAALGAILPVAPIGRDDAATGLHEGKSQHPESLPDRSASRATGGPRVPVPHSSLPMMDHDSGRQRALRSAGMGATGRAALPLADLTACVDVEHVRSIFPANETDTALDQVSWRPDDATSLIIGRVGESIVFQELRRECGDGARVTWVNAAKESTKPYDIHVAFRGGGGEMYVEVKCTTGAAATQPFFISPTEVAEAVARGDNYWLFLVYGLRLDRETDQFHYQLRRQPAAASALNAPNTGLHLLVQLRTAAESVADATPHETAHGSIQDGRSPATRLAM